MRKDTVYIKYIGEKSVKYDTVMRSPLKWSPREILPVEDMAVAEALLKHPTIWVEVEEKDYLRQQESIAQAEAEMKRLAEAEEARLQEEGAGSSSVSEEADMVEFPADPPGGESGLGDAEDLEAQVMRLHAEGKKSGEIGKDLGLHHSKVQAIIKRNTHQG